MFADLQYSWSKPAGTTFDPVAANTLDPKVSFSGSGNYSFTLTANDGYTTTTSDPVNVPVNYPPLVSASVDDDIPDFPAYQVTLTGSATNPDGLPAPSEISEYFWEKVSGPGNVNFNDQKIT